MHVYFDLNIFDRIEKKNTLSDSEIEIYSELENLAVDKKIIVPLITSDKIVGEELLKHITTNFDLYKMYSDNKEFKEDFSAMMFNVVKEILKTGIGGS